MKIKGKNTLKIIAIIMLAIIMVSSISLWSKAATGDLVSITFKDQNLYNAMIDELGRKIEKQDAVTKTISISEANLATVTALDLNSKNISDISGIENFTNLISLNVSGNNEIRDISKIGNLKSLEILDISDNTLITNISALSNLINITDLNLSNVPVGSLSSIKNLTKLKKLNIRNSNMNNDGTLRGFTELEELNISSNLSFTDFEYVNIPSLKKLNLSNTTITKIEGIRDLVLLEELDLSGCIYVQDFYPIYETDDNGVAWLKNLKTLKLNSLNLYDIGNVKTLEGLTHLEAANNEISYINPDVVSLRNLEILNLSHNKLMNTEGLVIEQSDGDSINYTPTSAKIIKLDHNQIGSWEMGKSGIDNFKFLDDNVKEIDLSYNNISYVGDIAKFIVKSSPTDVRLNNQVVDWEVYKKITNQDQYIILPSLFQTSRNSNYKTYAEMGHDEKGIKINPDANYQNVGYYNVIIDGYKTEEDELSLTINGGVADKSILKLHMTDSTSAIDSILFKDKNLANGVIKELERKKDNQEIQYLVKAPEQPMLINTLNSDLLTVTDLELSNKDNIDANKIVDLTGLSNFVVLRSLNLSNNKISNEATSKISELETMPNLEILYLNKNQLTDYDFIDEMYYLKILDLSDNKITNANGLKKYLENSNNYLGTTYLELLNIANNEIGQSNPVEVINKITTLKTLDISNTKIKDIKDLETLTNLINFSVDSNEIEDISVVKNFRDLDHLSISNNNIESIKDVEGLPIRALNMSTNKISDLTPLRNTSSLTSLDMRQNKIEDISPISRLDALEKAAFKMQNQNITRNITDGQTGIIQIQLPQIFKEVKNSSNTYVYTDKDFALSNCTLSSDGKYIEINLDEMENKVATITVKGGQADGTKLSVGKPVQGYIAYNPTTKTKGPVVATITFDKPNVTITNNEGKRSYTFNENGEFEFEFQDEYGFIGVKKAVVDWIDNKAPVVKGIKDGEIKDTDVTLQITDESEFTITLTKDGRNVTYNNGDVITEEGSYVLKVEDEVGNVTTVKFKISKTPVEKDDTVTSSVYNVNGQEIKDVPLKTSVTNFMRNISCESEYVIKDVKGNEITGSTYVGTGCKVVVESGKEYTIIILGDADGSGKIELKELAKVQKIYLGLQTANSMEKIVYDVDKNGRTELKDLAKLQKAYLSLINL